MSLQNKNLALVSVENLTILVVPCGVREVYPTV